MGESETLTKGATFHAALQLLKERHGEERIEALLDQVQGPMVERLRNGTLLASSWYPVAWQNELARVLSEELKFTRSDIRQLGHDLALRDFRGVYRFFMKLLSPQVLAGLVPRATGQYYKGGTITVAEASYDHARVEYRGWTGFTILTWQTTIGGTVAGLEVCGAKDVTADVLEGGRGADAKIVFRWKA